MAGLIYCHHWVTHGLLCFGLGISSEGFARDSFSEQTAAKDLPSKDGGAWVLAYRAGPACPFLLHEEREKPNRNELHLDLHVSRNLCVWAMTLCMS